MPSRFAIFTSLFYFFYFWATAVFVIFVPKTLLDLGYTTAEIGILLSVMPLIRFITPFLFSSKLKLTKETFYYSLIFSTLLFAGFVFTYHSFWLLFLNTLLYGLFITITLPYVDSVALKEIKKEKYGLIRLFGSIGFMGAAIALGKMELDKETVFLHYLISVALMSVFGALLASKEKIETESEQAAKETEGDLKRYIADSPFWLAMILVQLSFGAFYGFFTVFEHENGITLENITYLWSIGVLAEIFMFAFQGKLLKNIRPLFVIKLTIVSLVARWLLLHFFEGNFFAVALAQITHALNFALFTTAAFLYIFNRYEDKKRAQMHFYGLSYGLGGFFGSIISGALYGPNIFLYSALFAAFSLAAIALYKPTR
jgi:PPP family 3-phenylpropionic acid transporter